MSLSLTTPVACFRPSYHDPVCSLGPGPECPPGYHCEGTTCVQPGDAAVGACTGTTCDAAGRNGCNGALDCARLVFVSSKTYVANLGGVSGADHKCQALADSAAAPIAGRTFLAWLGSLDSSAALRLPHGSQPYRLPNDAVVAGSWTDLTDGSLQVGIDITDLGTPYRGNVWTGTDAMGNTYVSNCDDWTSTGSTGGAYGIAGHVDRSWTDGGGVYGCLTDLALYCVEY